MADDVDPRVERSIRARQTFRVVTVLGVVALLGIWAFVNTGEVRVDWIVRTTTAPLVAVIASSAALGFLTGLLVGRYRRN